MKHIKILLSLLTALPLMASADHMTDDDRLYPWETGVYCEKVHIRNVTDNQGYITGFKKYYLCSNGHSYVIEFPLVKPNE